MRTLVTFAATDKTSEREAILDELRALFSDSLPAVDSKDDAEEHRQGKSNDAWNEWSASVGARIDPMYGVRMYKRLVIVTESPVLGKGNGGLAASFFSAGSQVYYRSLDNSTVRKAVRFDVTNDRSYQRYGQLVFA